MELALVFYPSLAIGICLFLLKETRAVSMDGLKHGDRMYELGKRHGREEAAFDIYRLSLILNGDLGEEEGEQ